MHVRSIASPLLSAWWGASFRPAAWFAYPYGSEQQGTAAAVWEPLAFACHIASPVLAVGVIVDAIVMGGNCRRR